jgi:hypothetical protein
MEIITINAENIRSIPTTSSADMLMDRYRRQWCSHKVYADDVDEEKTLGDATFWAALYMRESNPTLFKLCGNDWNTNVKQQLEKIFARIEMMINSGKITGDVVFYRSQSRRLTKSKYPLCNNDVYAIFTGNPEWIMGDSSRWRNHTGELDSHYEQFRNKFTVYEDLYNIDLNGLQMPDDWQVGPQHRGSYSRFVQNKVAEREQFNMRVAYIWCMLTDERPFITNRAGLDRCRWSAILDDCGAPQRAGLLLWKEGKNRLWWQHSSEALEPQHNIGTGSIRIPTSFENSGLDIDNSGRLIEAND